MRGKRPRTPKTWALCGGILVFFLGVFSHAAYRLDQWIPQTKTLDPGFVQVSLERKATLVKDKQTSPMTSSLGTSFGVWANEQMGVEAGVTWEEPSREHFTQALFGHLRVRAKDLEKDKWSVALGVEHLGFVTNKNDQNMLYLSFENEIAPFWIVGLGGYNGSSRFFVDDRGKEDPRGAFVGIWRQIQRQRGRVALEYQSGQNFKGYLFTGMTLELSELVWGTIGYGYANNRTNGVDWVLARISADF